MVDYSKEDELQKQCDHEVWIAICVHCGKVIEDSEWKKSKHIGTSASKSREYCGCIEWN